MYVIPTALSINALLPYVYFALPVLTEVTFEHF